MKSHVTLTAALSILLAAGIAFAGDVIRIENGGTQEKGVIVDGVVNGGYVNDAGFQEFHTGSLLEALYPVIPLANFTESPHDEIVAFAGRRPPVLRSVSWTGGNDSVPVEFEDEYRILVHAWILASPFEELESSVRTAGISTASVWSIERTGLAFDNDDNDDNPLHVIDATDLPGADQFRNFHCGMVGDMKNLGLFIEGSINTYWVDTVDFGAGASTVYGVYCGEGLIAMGRNTGGHLLTHELGHALALGHTNSMTEGFGLSNIMHSSSPNRQFFTEGQTFRIIFHPGSEINDLYHVRDGQPTRTCLHNLDTDDDDCPALHKRIWSDGSAWPPN